jgi:hypothetical protein
MNFSLFLGIIVLGVYVSIGGKVSKVLHMFSFVFHKYGKKGFGSQLKPNVSFKESSGASIKR